MPATGPRAAGDQPILIGAQGGYAFKGELDDVRFYNRALSAGEVTALYEREKPSTSATTNSPEAAAGIETAIRNSLKKPTGELTEADLEKVKRLDLDGHKITDLTPLTVLAQLRELRLRNNQITDVSPLAKLTRLTHLSFVDNQITDVSALAKLPHLMVLDLYDNQFKNTSSLTKLTHLRDLDLRYNRNLTKAQIAELQKTLPNCKITHNATK